MSFIYLGEHEICPGENTRNKYRERRKYNTYQEQGSKNMPKNDHPLGRNEMDCVVALSLLKKGVKHVSIDVYNRFFR
ncbi:hypothetical protein THOM_2821 [Trachipleistophora hominis]|uniref:Uncharacterized protein n=1 Tax=Trachipleistophora hominis TaxID=72359 RepID=L7JS55_TRAHO|nr:hypothetical protein THOM_2821 [Trachipleistophora hominis]